MCYQLDFPSKFQIKRPVVTQRVKDVRTKAQCVLILVLVSLEEGVDGKSVRFERALTLTAKAEQKSRSKRVTDSTERNAQ